tara:strand:+ start:157 stop:666 length:510 start_codon:yes stop_codon:yes gene_type:complete
MPKAKPDQVVVHRIEFQSKEREMLETLVTTQAVQGGVKAIDELLSFENLYLGITVAEIVTGREILYGTPNDLNDIVTSVREWWAANSDSLDFIFEDDEMPWWGILLPLPVRLLLWPGSFWPDNPQNPGDDYQGEPSTEEEIAAANAQAEADAAGGHWGGLGGGGGGFTV